MKLHLPKMLACALLTAVMANPAVYAGTLTGATLTIDSFTADTVTALSQNGWSLSNVTGTEGGTFTSTSNRAVITSTNSTALATLQAGTTDRYCWAAVVTVDMASLKNAILVQAQSGGTLGMGIGWTGNSDAGVVTGVWQTTNPYSTMSITSFEEVYGNGDGTITLGVSSQGGNGTTICVGSQTIHVDGLRWSSQTDKILLSNVAGVTYDNLYWFNTSFADNDLKTAVATVGSVKTGSYTWNGTGADSEWNFTSENWLKESEAAAISNGATTITFGNGAEVAKEISVSSTVGAASINVQDDYTFRMADNALLQVPNLTIAAGKTMTVDGGVSVGTLSTTGKLSATSVSITDAKLLGRNSDNLDTTDLHLVSSSALDNGTTTAYAGNLTVEQGVTLTTTAGKTAPSNLSSLSGITLNGGTLSSNSSIGTLKALSVTSNGGRIQYTDFPNFEGGKPTVTDQWAKMTLNGDLTLYTEYKSSTAIGSLSGSGTLTATSSNRNDGGNNITINSLKDFIGNITLQPGATTNKVALSLVNNTAAGSVDTITMKNGSTLNISGSQALTAEKILMTGGTLTIDGSVNTTQLMMSKEGATVGSITVKEGATLHITGTTTSAPEGGKGGSFELCNWGAANTLTIYGKLISEAGITMEGPGTPIVNIEDGGTLTMNDGLKVAKRQGSPLTTINVKNGGTLNAAGSSALANTDYITVNLQDGATLGGAYGSGTTAIINKNFALAEDATVTLQTATEKQLTLNGTFGTATNSLVVQGGGQATLGEATSALKSVTIKENTGLTLAGATSISDGLTITSGASLVANGTLTLSGTASYTGATNTREVARTGDNGFGSTVAYANVISGEGDVSNSATWTLNDNAATLNGKELSYVTGATKVYYINTNDEIKGVTADHIGNAGGNITTAVKLGGGNSTAAIILNGTQTGTTYTFSGAVSGNGNFVVQPTTAAAEGLADTYKFSGDISAWTGIGSGSFIAAGNANLIFTGNSTEINVNVMADGGHISATYNHGTAVTINGDVDNDPWTKQGSLDLTVTNKTAATFNGYVVADKLTVDMGSTVTFTDEASLASVAGSGAMKLDGNEMTVAGNVGIGALTLSNGATITAETLTDAHNGTITLTGLKVTDNGSAMNGNLVMAGGYLIFADNTTLTMGCDVTIGSVDNVSVVLTDTMITTIANGGRVTLFTDVERANLVEGNISFAGENYYTLANSGAYSLKYDEASKTIYVTPEPATATLSLLALAALAARRKRH